MLLTDRQFIKLVAEALAGDILPDVTTPGARSLGGMAVDALRELIKRHDVLPDLVRRLAPAGLGLARELDRFGMGANADEIASIAAQLDREAGHPAHGFARLVKVLDDGACAILTGRDAMTREQAGAATKWLRRAAEWDQDYYASFAAAPLPEIADRSSTVQPLTRDKLERHLRERLAEPALAVTDLVAIPGGMLNEIFFCTIKLPGSADRDVVVRKNVAQPLFNHGAHRVTEEFFILKCISDQGLPVPEPLWLFRELPDVDGNFYIQSRGRGKMVGGLMGAHQKLPEKLLFSLAEFLARLHAIPSESFAPYFNGPDSPVRPGETVQEAVTRNVENFSRVWLTSGRKPSPSEAFTIDWLRRNVPENTNPAVMLHTDCFVHNFLVENDEIACVLDWECAHFGDPAEDLAYIKAYVSEHMEWDRFVAHYRKAGGQPIHEDYIDYYTALLHFRNFWGCNVGTTRAEHGFSEVRLIPLGSEHRTRYMGLCLNAAYATGKE